MEVGIRVETEYSRSYTEDIILDIDIIQIWKRRYFSRPLSVPFLFLYFNDENSTVTHETVDILLSLKIQCKF